MFTAFGAMCCLLCADCVASDRLEMIDAAECWNNVLWNIVDSVAGRLMDAGGSSRDLFKSQNRVPLGQLQLTAKTSLDVVSKFTNGIP
jgi:hypothetical protein